MKAIVQGTYEQAAVIAVSGPTALHALRDDARVEPGRTVLTVGASGGVGSYAVQIAKAYGAHVTGVCRTTKVDLVRSLMPAIDRVYPLGDTPEAIRYLAEGNARGKVAITLCASSPSGRLQS